MNNQLLICLIILLVISIFYDRWTNSFLKTISCFFIIWIILGIFNIFRINPYHRVIFAASIQLILVFLNIFIYQPNQLVILNLSENFDNADDIVKAIKDKEQSEKNISTSDKILTSEINGETNENIDKKNLLRLDRISDIAEHTPIPEMTPKQAQQTTFQLVSTVKELMKTMDQLKPVLKESKEIFDTYKNIKL